MKQICIGQVKVIQYWLMIKYLQFMLLLSNLAAPLFFGICSVFAQEMFSQTFLFIPCPSEVSALHLSYPRSEEEEQGEEESQSNQWTVKLDKARDKTRTNWMMHIVGAQASEEQRD